MADVSLKTVQLANGETLGYREREGGEQQLLLIHGNMTSSKHWDLVIENLDPHFKVIAVDLRGFGLSTYHQPIHSLKDFSEDIKLFIDQLGLKRFSVVGWSTGGGVAMQFAADYPEHVEKLVLVASVSTQGYPFYNIDQLGQVVSRCRTRAEIEKDPLRTIPIGAAHANRDKEYLRKLWNSVIYTQKQPPEELYEEYLEDMLTQRNLVDVYHALNIFNISMEENEVAIGSGDVSKIKAPTLVLWGENDLVVPVQMALDIKKDLNEIAELIYLENCGHSPMIDDLEGFLERVTIFLGGSRP